MTMTPPLRKFVLTVHVTASVGWLGAIIGFLALAVAVLTTRDVQTVRGAYLAMEVIGWLVVVPLSLASLASGLVQSLGSQWGLVKHYWVLAKLLMNVVATGVLLMFMQDFGKLAGLAAQPILSAADLTVLTTDPQPVAHAGTGLVLLLVAVTLSVYKPRGLTRYGRRGQHMPHTEGAPAGERVRSRTW